MLTNPMIYTDGIGDAGDGYEKSCIFLPDSQIDGAIHDENERNVVTQADEQHRETEQHEHRVGEQTNVQDAQESFLKRGGRFGR